MYGCRHQSRVMILHITSMHCFMGMPDIYLGGKISKVELMNGTKADTFSSSQYVKGAVANVELYLKECNQKLPSRASIPLTIGYRPEIDTSDELN